tara:strand:- start:361 stop:585 length:225 start_codon:yes stop_codon:yes gene_type:complete
MKEKENNNMNVIGMIIFILLSIKIGQYIYKNQQEKKRNTYLNTSTSEQIERIIKSNEKFKKNLNKKFKEEGIIK